MEETKKGRFSAGPLTFAVRHELWDGNIQDHPDQGVVILVKAPSRGSRLCTNVTTGRTRASLADCGPGGGFPPCEDAAPGSRLLSATRMTDTLARIPIPVVRASYTPVGRVVCDSSGGPPVNDYLARRRSSSQRVRSSCEARSKSER